MMKTKYYVKIAGIPKSADLAIFGHMMEHRNTIAAFQASAKMVHVSAKHRSYAAAWKEFKGLYKPSEWYCVTREGPMYKDDSIQIWFKVVAPCCTGGAFHSSDCPKVRP